MVTGRCECGRVKYRIDGEINDFSHCHCSQCRRLHGAAFASFGGVKREDFSYTSGKRDIACYASSGKIDRFFCVNCGSSILLEFSDQPESFFITMGTIDGNPKLPPAYHIFVASMAPWHKFRDQARRYDEFPDDS